MDLLFIALILLFLFLSWGFVRLCASLEPLEPHPEGRK
jgi:flagellar biogenesis protein FliO